MSSTPHQNNPTPVPISEALPHRKVLRSWLESLMQRSTPRALFLLVVDYVLFFALISAAVAAPHWTLRLLAGLVAGFWIGRLFILGHDACHQSYTPSRGLNRVLGRIAFLPSLSAYSLWEVGHNVIHHGFTNLKGADFVWVPKTKAEYDEMSLPRRMLERIYRSGWGVSLYYMVEIWWNKMFFPNKANKPSERPAFIWDNLLVSAFALIWIAAIVVCAPMVEVPIWSALLTAFVVPFIFWNGMIGWVVYVHHTHERIAWYDDKKTWAAAQPFVTTTVHLTFKRHFGSLVHHIMEHTAHHLDMSIPLYKLKEAQSRLEHLLPQRIVVQPFSWTWYFKTARKCKLYDYAARRWTDFKGVPTTEAATVKC